MNFLPIWHILQGWHLGFNFRHRRKYLFTNICTFISFFLHRYSNIVGSHDNRCWAMSGVKSSPWRSTIKCAQVSRTVFWCHPVRTHPQQILQGYWRHRYHDPHEREGIPYDVFSRHLNCGHHSNQYTFGTVHTCAIRVTVLFHSGIREISANHHFLTSFLIK